MDEYVIDCARIEIISAEDDRISPVDNSNLNPDIKPLTSHLKGTIGLDGEIEGGTGEYSLEQREWNHIYLGGVSRGHKEKVSRVELIRAFVGQVKGSNSLWSSSQLGIHNPRE